MTDRASVYQVTQLGMESTAGTGVAATKLLASMQWTPQVMVEEHSYRPMGYRYPTTGAIGKEWTQFKIAGEPSYGELPYLFAGLYGKKTPSQIAPTQGVYQWVWTPSSTTPATLQTYTVEHGSAVRASKAAYGLITGMDLKADRKQLQISGEAVAQSLTDGISLTALAGTNEGITSTITGTPTGGTQTYTFRGQATTAVAFNASAATLQAALRALSTIGGNVVVTGGPGPGTPYLITFSGQLGDQPIGSQLTVVGSFTGGSTPAIALSQTTPGVAISPEEPISPVLPTQIALYLDNSSTALGTTLFTDAFTYEFNVSGAETPIWPFQQGNTTFPAHVDLVPKTSVKFYLEANAQGMTPLTSYLRPNAPVFVRFAAVGASLDGTNNQQLLIDTALRLKQPSEFKDMDGIYGLEFEGEIVHDTGWGQGLQITLNNLLPAL